MLVRLPLEEECSNLFMENVFRVLNNHKGNCEVLFDVPIKNGIMVRTRLHGNLRVKGNLKMETDLQQVGCSIEWLGLTSITVSKPIVH